MAAEDSIISVVQKAQQEPQLPWSFTSLTAPLSLQSTDSGRSLALFTVRPSMLLATMGVFLYPPMWKASNSDSVRSLNWLTPMVQLAPDWLCSSYFFRFSEKILNLLICSDLVWYCFPNCSLN